MNRDSITRIGLVVLAVPSVVIGGWAGLAPRSFYDDFPGFGAHWVSPDGPFNEHLVRDVGWLNLSLALITLIAAWTLTRALVGAALGAWLVYGIPHLVYHLNHLDMYKGSDQILLTISLSFSPLVAAGLLVYGRRGGLAGRGGKMTGSNATASSSGSST
jgi:hypothetical protein